MNCIDINYIIWCSLTRQHDMCQVPNISCCCQKAKSQNWYTVKGIHFWGKEIIQPAISLFLEVRGEGGHYFVCCGFSGEGRGPKNIKQSSYRFQRIVRFDTTQTFRNRREIVSIRLIEFTMCRLWYDSYSDFCFRKDFARESVEIFEIAVQATQNRYCGRFQ